MASINRRDFLKTTGATTLTVAATSLLADQAAAAVTHGPAVSPRLIALQAPGSGSLSRHASY